MRTRAETKPGWKGVFYTGTVALMALTGFGQMPIYKRYYLSEIPGLGWLADFWVTRNIHYAGAALVLALAAYTLTDFLLSRRKGVRLSGSGVLRGALVAAIAVSGGLIVYKNFPYAGLSDGFIIALNLFHMSAAMALLAASLVCRVLKKKWTRPAGGVIARTGRLGPP